MFREDLNEDKEFKFGCLLRKDNHLSPRVIIFENRVCELCKCSECRKNRDLHPIKGNCDKCLDRKLTCLTKGLV